MFYPARTAFALFVPLLAAANVKACSLVCCSSLVDASTISPLLQLLGIVPAGLSGTVGFGCSDATLNLLSCTQKLACCTPETNSNYTVMYRSPAVLKLFVALVASTSVRACSLVCCSTLTDSSTALTLIQLLGIGPTSLSGTVGFGCSDATTLLTCNQKLACCTPLTLGYYDECTPL
ncbi:hypothetical protein GALMADRAFT_147324 [Galerina marginata CBS 339.88]|uniref:Hydrophobin n=1 Tax=Galerina marginata (strain CBS 339.88) TaxID=685588 RepID=A0A067SK11_GALM3|nr:hypothetical protein GALMADRAFT_147324 [Galerina marginata CBS 339.88]